MAIKPNYNYAAGINKPTRKTVVDVLNEKLNKSDKDMTAADVRLKWPRFYGDSKEKAFNTWKGANTENKQIMSKLANMWEAQSKVYSSQPVRPSISTSSKPTISSSKK